MIDYKLKSDILLNHSDILNLEKKYTYYNYALADFYNNGIYRDILDNKELIKKFEFFSNIENYKLIKECSKINQSSYKRTKRLKDRIIEMFNNGECLFITLTFKDELLNNTTPEYRRKLVSRYLKKTSLCYVANIDFGKTNHREHYHAVVLSNKLDLTLWHPYGAIKALRCHNNQISACKLSKYVCKLTNHAIKETTKQIRIIYSK